MYCRYMGSLFYRYCSVSKKIRPGLITRRSKAVVLSLVFILYYCGN